MFTILMSIVGLMVFIVSLVTTTFKVAFKRFLMFVITGMLMDILMFAIIGTVVYSFT
jgi:hypothetical protein